MTQQDKQADPWNSAANAKALPRGPWHVFGQVLTDAFFCVLRKGIGKVPFDPSQHPVEDRRTAVTVEMVPLTRDGVGEPVTRDLIAESREWAGIILPSIKALEIVPGSLNNQWAHAVMEKTGATYVSKSSGETIEKTTFKFLELFPDEAATRAAADAFFENLRTQAGDEDEQSELPLDPPSKASTPPVNDQEKLVAAKFLPALYAQAHGDPTKLAELLANNPLTSRYFDINSPEVTALFGS